MDGRYKKAYATREGTDGKDVETFTSHLEEILQRCHIATHY